MTKLAKKLKGGISRAINRLGYAVVRLPPPPQKTFDVVEMVVAGKKIKVHGGNPLHHVYLENPQCNSHMGQVAALVKEKYPVAWAVDVGANVGDTLAIIRSHTKIPIICVEGDSHCFELLKENARQFDEVHLFNVFLSNEPRSVFMATEKEGWNTTLVESKDENDGQRINFETVDMLAERLNCQSVVKLLKVDTEGYDMRILRGAATVLKTAQPVISFELNKENISPLGDSVPDFFDHLGKLGYEYLLLANPDGRPVCTLRPEDKSLLSSLYQYSGPKGGICYFDVWAFHRSDHDLFKEFLATY